MIEVPSADHPRGVVARLRLPLAPLWNSSRARGPVAASSYAAHRARPRGGGAGEPAAAQQPRRVRAALADAPDAEEDVFVLSDAWGLSLTALSLSSLSHLTRNHHDQRDHHDVGGVRR